MANFCKHKNYRSNDEKNLFCFSSRPNDRIINVSGRRVVRSMEYQALKLIRESTDFVHLVTKIPLS